MTAVPTILIHGLRRVIFSVSSMRFGQSLKYMPGRGSQASTVTVARDCVEKERMPGEVVTAHASPELVFAGAGASSSSSGLCSIPSLRLALLASGPNVLVVDSSPSIPEVSSVLSTRPGAKVAGIAACVDSASASSIGAAAALADGGLAVWVRDAWSWGSACIVEATGGGGKLATPLVSVCAVHSTVESCFSVVTAAMESTKGAGLCSLWQFTAKSRDDESECKSDTPRKVAWLRSSPSHMLPECVAATYVRDSLVIALAGTDRAVRLYCRDDDRLIPLLSPLVGHRDWVRGLSFSPQLAGDPCFQLATASTDATVRVWKFAPDVPSASNDGGDTHGDDRDIFEENVNRARVPFRLCGDPWTATLEGLLVEHDRAVLSVAFCEDETAPLSLLTASIDGSVAVWHQERIDHLSDASAVSPWTVSARFGLLGGAGAAALGFSSAAFVNYCGTRVLAHTLGGSVHSWRVAEMEPGDDMRANSNAVFVAESAPGGHTGPVNSVVWEPRGRFLVSCGDDKTTRIFAPFPFPSSSMVEWARPQVHGHSVRDVVFLDRDGMSLASVSDEKVVRLFDAPEQFACSGASAQVGSLATDRRFAAVSATLPELGLSNKPQYRLRAVSSADDAEDSASVRDSSIEDGEEIPLTLPSDSKDEGMIESFGARRDISSAPLEVELRQDRLWPERAKLYGHGNDVCCLAVDLSNGVLASASSAQGKRDAFIILWEIESGLERARLFGHDLTVNHLAFSSDGELLLSVSRDRSFVVFRRDVRTLVERGDKFCFSLSARVEEAHGRLLHSGCWMHGSALVVTGSRDRSMKLWHYDGESCTELLSRKFSSGVSALDVARFESQPKNVPEILAIGFECGQVRVSRVSFCASTREASITIFAQLSASSLCCGRVTCLSWRPAKCDGVPDAEGQLAIASVDHSVRIVKVPVDD